MPMNRGFIIDFTLDEDEKVHILELGMLERSGTTGFSAITQNDVYRQFQTEIAERYPAKKPPNLLRFDYNKEGVSLRTFKPDKHYSAPLSTYYEYREDRDYITNGPVLMRLLLLLATYPNPTDRPIILEEDGFIDALEFLMLKFWLNQQLSRGSRNGLLVDSFYNLRLADACNDKAVSHWWLADNCLYPQTMQGTLPLLHIGFNTPRQRIIDFCAKTPGDYVVLKPADAAVSAGVNIFHKKNIIEELSRIYEIDGSRDDTWHDSEFSGNFVLQAFVPSKTIVAENEKSYHPTGRLIFELTEGDVQPAKCIGAYWKLPTTCAHSSSTSFDSAEFISKVHREEDMPGYQEPFSAVISDTDMRTIMAQIEKHFYPELNTMQDYVRPSAKVENDFKGMQASYSRNPVLAVAVIREFCESLYEVDAKLILVLAGLPTLISEYEQQPLEQLWRQLPRLMAEHHRMQVDAKQPIIQTRGMKKATDDENAQTMQHLRDKRARANEDVESSYVIDAEHCLIRMYRHNDDDVRRTEKFVKVMADEARQSNTDLLSPGYTRERSLRRNERSRLSIN